MNPVWDVLALWLGRVMIGLFIGSVLFGLSCSAFHVIKGMVRTRRGANQKRVKGGVASSRRAPSLTLISPTSARTRVGNGRVAARGPRFDQPHSLSTAPRGGSSPDGVA